MAKIIFIIALGAVISFASVLFACSSKVKHVTLDQHEAQMSVGQKKVLSAEVDVGSSSLYSGLVEWESSDEDIVTVQSGIVTALSVGNATVTVTAKGTSVSDSCVVTVTTKDILRVGVKDDVDNFGKFNTNLRSYEGMEVDLAKKIATALYYEDVEYTTVTSDNRIDYLDEDFVDCVIATFTITDERKELVNFSSPYYTDFVQILVNQTFISERGASLNEFSAGMVADPGAEKVRVGYVSSTTAYAAFTEYCRNSDIVLSDDMRGDFCTAVPYDDYASCESALAIGDIDMFVGDHSILSSYATSSMVFLDDAFGAQDYGVATAKVKSGEVEGGFSVAGDDLSELGKDINDLIDLWIEDGTLDDFLAEYGLQRYT
ncbi:MAG: transporter substrate-binding domain-containing protein [Clostridia bacterium]|nr:transporter substrate-binding domain-containing protein [Clostridia bacterium]